MSEQEQAKDVIDAKKRGIENMEIHEGYERVAVTGEKCISTRGFITEFQGQYGDDESSPCYS